MACTFDFNILLILLAIWTLRHDFVQGSGFQCNEIFLVCDSFSYLLLLLFLSDSQTTELSVYFSCSASFFLFLSLTR